MQTSMPEIPAGLKRKGAAPPRAGRTEQVSGETLEHFRRAGVDLAKARTVKEEFRARMVRLDYETAVGRLLVAEDVRAATALCAAAIVAELDRLAHLAEELTAAAQAGGVPGVRGVLRKATRDLRRSIAGKLRDLERNPPKAAAPPAG